MQFITYGGPNAVALRVYQSSDLSKVTVPLGDVLYAGGLHEEGVVCGQDSCDPFFVILHKRCVLPAAHKCPHLLIC